MSVPVGKRGEGKLQVLRYTRDLAVLTTKTLRREDVIPKSSRWLIAHDIAHECMKAYKHIRRANLYEVNPEKQGYKQAKKNFRSRRKHQLKAYKNFECMLGLLDIAYNAFEIPDYKMEEWAGLVVETSDKLASWARSDKRRYEELLKTFKEKKKSEKNTTDE